MYRSAAKPIPDPVLYPWPLPDVFGLSLDPRKRATVARVEKGSTAERSGFRVGDELVSLEGQPLISVADVQWVLHGAGEEGSLSARVRRGEKEEGLTIPLERGWRKRTEIGWRATTWELRRMSLGGLVLEELPAGERAGAGLAGNALALRVKHVGEYGTHAVAKKAGVKKGDVIVAVDGKSDRLSESDLIAYGVQTRKPGDALALTVLRKGERKELSFTLQ
jgi:S1-C subfamily serine protease